MRNLLAYPDESRVWIYQAETAFQEVDIPAINEDIDRFCAQWTSHSRELRALGGVMHDLFVVLVVDETKAPTSGCSIDKSVAFVKSLEQKYGCRLLERNNIAWLDEQEQIHITPLQQLKSDVQAGRIQMGTYVFDNLVANRKDFIGKWVVPLEQSWVKRFV